MLCFRFFFQMKESLLWTIVPFLAIVLSLEAVTGNKVGVSEIICPFSILLRYWSPFSPLYNSPEWWHDFGFTTLDWKALNSNSYNNFFLIGSGLVKAYEVGSSRIDAHICGDHITEVYKKVCIDESVGKRKRSKRILLFLLWPEILNH